MIQRKYHSWFATQNLLHQTKDFVHVSNIVEVLRNLLKDAETDVEALGEMLFDEMEKEDDSSLRDAAFELYDILDNALER